jgi:hypothetical protein
MPITFELGPEPDRWTVVLSGMLSAEDLKRGFDLQIELGAWTRQTLVDMTRVTGLSVHFAEMQALVRFVRALARTLPTRGPAALVAPGDLAYGVARMYQTSMAHAMPSFRVEVVRSYPEGIAFLDRQRRPTPLMLEAMVICPVCAHASTDTMPTDRCVLVWICPACQAVTRPKPGDCCVYCSYGDRWCPPIQAGGVAVRRQHVTGDEA